ncbi:hypothetical protein WN944_009896 [Citrus x changshan-huyou]|uniref:Uncharacterized protein n=1 Tax=Citrus x changshan-huyou TaxID=2935761 RepID=A0AAP0QSF7_9ROSI
MKGSLFAILLLVLAISFTQASARVLAKHVEANEAAAAAAKQKFFGLFWPRFGGLPPLPSAGWVPPPLPATHQWPCPFPWMIPHWLPSLPPLPSHH